MNITLSRCIGVIAMLALLVSIASHAHRFSARMVIKLQPHEAVADE